MVWSQIKIRFEVIPDDSMVPSRLMSGTIVQTVKVWMQRMIKIDRSVGFAMRNAKYLDVLPVSYTHLQDIDIYYSFVGKVELPDE